MQNNLKKIREGLGLSQLKLFSISAVPPNIISNLENGKVYPYKGWRKKLAAALGVAEEAIFPGEVGKEDETRKAHI